MLLLETLLTPEQRAEFSALTTPIKIQAYLESIPYAREDRNRSVLGVIQDRQCHCLDGGLLAAAALRRIGYTPAIMEMWPDPGTDDDHVLALYRVDGYWGAVAKSNFPGLRFREPIYRNLRELVLSYFELFFSLDGVKTMRRYSLPLDLTAYDAECWETEERTADKIEKRMYKLRTYPIITEKMAANLSLVDERSFRSGTYGTNPNETFKD